MNLSGVATYIYYYYESIRSCHIGFTHCNAASKGAEHKASVSAPNTAVASTVAQTKHYAMSVWSAALPKHANSLINFVEAPEPSQTVYHRVSAFGIAVGRTNTA
jgi:hypothetical protein